MKANYKEYFTNHIGLFLFALALAGGTAVSSPISQAKAKPALNKKSASVKEGKTIKLSVKKANKKVKWSSSNRSVAKIRSTSGKKKQNAVILGVSKGKAVITAKVGSKKLKATVTVKHVQVKHVHKYSAATCTSPRSCSCGRTQGNALGHAFGVSNCMTASTCSRCGAKGAAGNHNYVNGICTVSGCGEIDVKNLLKINIDNYGIEDSKHIVSVSLEPLHNLASLCLSQFSNIYVGNDFLSRDRYTTTLRDGSTQEVYLIDDESELLIWDSCRGGSSTSFLFSKSREGNKVTKSAQLELDLYFESVASSAFTKYHLVIDGNGIVGNPTRIR